MKGGFDAFAWLQDGQRYITAKNNELVISHTEKEAQTKHRIPNHPLQVHDMVLIPADEEGVEQRFVIMVCSIYLEPRNEVGHDRRLPPSDARWPPAQARDVQPQRRIIIYDLMHRKITTEVPIWGEAQYITVSRNGRFALVSYGSTSPPELWFIGTSATSMALCHIYLPPSTYRASEGTCGFVGRASFGGASDEYVVATTKDGYIYVWASASTKVCLATHDPETRDKHGEITAMTWVSPSKRTSPLFACGTTGGGVVLWSVKDTGRSATEERSGERGMSGARDFDLGGDTKRRRKSALGVASSAREDGSRMREYWGSPREENGTDEEGWTAAAERPIGGPGARNFEEASGTKKGPPSARKERGDAIEDGSRMREDWGSLREESGTDEESWKSWPSTSFLPFTAPPSP